MDERRKQRIKRKKKKEKEMWAKEREGEKNERKDTTHTGGGMEESLGDRMGREWKRDVIKRTVRKEKENTE